MVISTIVVSNYMARVKVRWLEDGEHKDDGQQRVSTVFVVQPWYISLSQFLFFQFRERECIYKQFHWIQPVSNPGPFMFKANV